MTEVVLNIRKGLTKKTRDKMRKTCKERGRTFTYGDLIEELYENYLATSKRV